MRMRVMVGALAVVVLAACGGASSATKRSDNASVLSVVAATNAGDSVRFVTVARSVESGTAHPQPQPVTTTTGEIDFAGHDGSQSQTSSDHSPFSSLELRWLDGRDFDHLDAADAKLEYGAPAGKTWIETDAAGFPRTAACYEYQDPLSAALGVSVNRPAPSDPRTLLDALRTAGARLVRVGTDSVRGVATTRWRVDTAGVTTTTQAAKCPQNLPLKFGPPSVEVWTDSQDRLRRIQISSTTTISAPQLPTVSGISVPSLGPTTLASTTTTDLFDYGVHVSVSPPPADQIDNVTSGLAALLRGPGTVASDAWRDVAQGTFRGKAWTVWYARTSTGWRCYQAQGAPPDPDATDGFDVGTTMPAHDGHPSECSPVPGGVFENGPFTAIVGGVDGTRSVLIGRVDESVTSARLVFVNGTSTLLAIDPTTRLVQWTGTSAQVPSKIDAGNFVCSLDDSTNQQCQGPQLDLPSIIQSAGPLTLPPGFKLPAGLKLPPGVKLAPSQP